MPEEDQAMDIGNMPKKFGKASKNLVKLAHVVPEISLWMERHRNRHTHHNTLQPLPQVEIEIE